MNKIQFVDVRLILVDLHLNQNVINNRKKFNILTITKYLSTSCESFESHHVIQLHDAFELLASKSPVTMIKL